MPGRFRALGVDGVFTDHPDVAVTALAHPAQL
jgi:glycerophosphoryl diester phosphodiesterase